MNIATASLSRQGTRASNQDQTGETIGERSACFVVCDGIAGRWCIIRGIGLDRASHRLGSYPPYYASAHRFD